MQPAIEAELAAVRRLLAGLQGEPELPPAAAADLTEAIRALERVEKSWSRVLPYLVFDNAAVSNLLLELAPELSPELRLQVQSTVSGVQPEPDLSLFDVAAADRRNQDLRALLARVISDPAGGAGTAALRSRIAACLERSLESKPW